jgi:hypothetical protein
MEEEVFDCSLKDEGIFQVESAVQVNAKPQRPQSKCKSEK